MTDRPHAGEVDWAQLGALLRVLGVPTRLALLRSLQRPQTSSEIRLTPFRQDPDLVKDRQLSRQAVEAHLRKLEAAGLVHSRPAKREGRRVVEWYVSQPSLFRLVDDVRRLALTRPAPTAVAQATAAGHEDEDWLDVDLQLPEGPALVLVGGPHEGRAFALDGSGPWRIGRAPDAEVPLAYDPFLSALNTEVRIDGEGAVVEDLASSRNGTTVNWRRIPKGRPMPLRAGDTVGAGRSLLLVRGL